jgi:hypothetical protein
MDNGEWMSPTTIKVKSPYYIVIQMQEVWKVKTKVTTFANTFYNIKAKTYSGMEIITRQALRSVLFPIKFGKVYKIHKGNNKTVYILAYFQKMKVGLSNQQPVCLWCLCLSACVSPTNKFESTCGFSWDLVGRYYHSRWPRRRFFLSLSFRNFKLADV